MRRDILKKLLSLIITVCMVATSVGALAFSDDFASGDAWEVSATAESKSDSGVLFDADGMHININTVGAAQKPNVTATREFDASGEVFALSARVKLSGIDDKVNRKLTVVKTNLKKAELFDFRGDKLYAFGQSAAVAAFTAEQDEWMDIFVTVDMTTSNGCLWADGKLVATGDTKWRADFNDSTLKIEAKSNSSSSIEAESDFVFASMKVDSLSANSGIAYTSDPEDGAKLLDSSTLGAIGLTFDSVTAPSNMAADNLTLTEDGTEIEFEVTNDGLVYSVVPKNGFAPGKAYVLTIADFVSIMGASQGAKTIGFTTKIEGYEKPVVTLDKSDYLAYDDETVAVIASVATLDMVTKVEFFVDGMLAETVTAAPYTFELTKPNGDYTVTAKAYDSVDGEGKASAAVRFVTNTAPTVECASLTDGGVYGEGDDFSKVAFDISDAAPGRIVSASLTVDGKPVSGFDKDNTTADLSALLTKGSHVIIATAEDEKGLVGRLEINITVVGADYVKPSVKLAASAAVYVGGTVTVTPKVTGSEAVQYVEFTVDGKSYKVTKAPFAYDFSLTAGVHEVSAVARDVLGSLSDAAKVNIEFKANTAPKVSAGIANGTTVSADDDFSAVSVTATDAEDNLKSVTVTFNGETVATETEGSFTVDLGGKVRVGENTLGIVAVDDGGLVGKYTAVFTADGAYTSRELFSLDFDSMEDHKLPVNIQNGDTAKTTYEFGIDGNDTKALVYRGFNNSDDDYYRIHTNEITSRLVFSFDMNWLSAEQHGSMYLIKESVGTGMRTPVQWNNGTAKLDGGASFKFERNKWYTYTYDVNFETLTYTLTVTDGDGTVVGSSKSVVPEGFKYTFFRLITHSNLEDGDKIPSEFAVDNMKAAAYNKPPIITGVREKTSDVTGSSLAPTATRFRIDIPAGLGYDNAADMSSLISITTDGEDMLIKSAAYDSKNSQIVIDPGESLRSLCDYVITLSADTLSADGVAIGAPLVKSFGVTAAVTDAEGISISHSGGKARVSGRIVNGDESVNCKAILTVYRGGEMTDICITPIHAEAFATTAFTTDYVNAADGDEINFVVIDSFESGRFITSKIYK